ncbi:MAG: purine-binding chemotaxis protein CheW [Bacteroidales bacterium]|nr:purine-binding chemotaxis protein CheW [Bacteroidales bacterium]
MTSTYLSFVICGDQYAVNVAKVLEVLQEEHITSVPNAPAYIRGIINFRGDVVPVFETRVRFNLPDRQNTDTYNIIVIDVSEGADMFRLGAVVDKVKDVISIEDNDIKPVPAMSKEFNTDFLQGIYKLENEFIMLLNVEKVFSGTELKAIKETNELHETLINS